MLDVSGWMTIHVDSPYRAARAAWGLRTYAASGGPLVEIGSALSSRVTVGAFGCLGYGVGGTSRGADIDTLSLWSAGVFARFFMVDVRAGVGRIRVGVHLDAGATAAAMQFRDAALSHTQVRWGGAAMIEYGAPAVALHGRIGALVSQWPDAGGWGMDMSLSGVTLTVGLSVRP